MREDHLRRTLERFAVLPDDALVSIPTVAALADVDERTARNDPVLKAARVFFTPHRYGVPKRVVRQRLQEGVGTTEPYRTRGRAAPRRG
jgi:hypothetical protein